MKVHLVDGTFELFRAYYGAPSARTADGREVGAVRGLLRSLLALATESGVTHVGVAFDHRIESFRNDLYAGYKTGDGVEPALLAQFELAERAADALGFVVWPMIEFEADDAIASAAARLADDARVDQVVILSPDKDLAQCISGRRVVGRDRIRRKTLDEAGVVDKFGVAPASIPDWLALVGDAADGIPGIRRWGAKSASAVLSVYGRIERIPDAAGEWTVAVRGAVGLAQNLADMRDEALLFRTLATLRRDVPIAETVDDLQWRGPRIEVLERLAREIDDTRIAGRAAQIAAARSVLPSEEAASGASVPSRM